jgi:signal transduction histidine kinase
MSRNATNVSTPSNTSIGKRLLFYILLFSSVVTIVATGLQLFIDYQRDISQVKTRLDNVQKSYLPSVAASLWNLDPEQLKIQMEGILQLPDVAAVAVHEQPGGVAKPIDITLGEFSQKRTINRVYPINYRTNYGNRYIGALQVQVSLQKVYTRLWDKLIIILLTQAVKTFLVSFFILFIVYRLVTSHLSHIAQHVRHFNLADSSSSLSLKRKHSAGDDELDQVVLAFNRLSDNLRHAYQTMRQINEALIHDVRARRAAENEVRELNSLLEERVTQRTAELQAANDELATFCYSVSHDLRAPLRRIEGFRRILVEQSGHLLPDKSHHYLNRIKTETAEMTDMIDGFLHLSKTTLGELNRELINVSEQVKVMFKDLRDPERDISLVVQPNIHVWADRRFFVMLMNNLLENSMKYSRTKAHTSIEVGECDYRGYRVLYVRDNGVGFDMSFSDRLFAPFSRFHKPEEFEGTGIGLATVQRIISRHGGHIWAESAPNEGATFYFCFTGDSASPAP